MVQADTAIIGPSFGTLPRQKAARVHPLRPLALPPSRARLIVQRPYQISKADILRVRFVGRVVRVNEGMLEIGGDDVHRAKRA